MSVRFQKIDFKELVDFKKLSSSSLKTTAGKNTIYIVAKSSPESITGVEKCQKHVYETETLSEERLLKESAPT